MNSDAHSILYAVLVCMLLWRASLELPVGSVIGKILSPLEARLLGRAGKGISHEDVDGGRSVVQPHLQSYGCDKVLTGAEQKCPLILATIIIVPRRWTRQPRPALCVRGYKPVL